jgi:hypothetical protein
MEDVRPYRIEDDQTERDEDRRRQDYEAAARGVEEDEVPFHIPRD